MSKKGSNKIEYVLKYIKDLISEKKLPENGKLPSENTIANNLRVSRSTVRRALSVLTAQNILFSKQGKGSFVNGYSNMSANKNIIPFILMNLEGGSRFSDIYTGAQDYLSKKGLALALYSSDFKFEKEKNIINRLYQEGYRNMFVMPSAHKDSSIFFLDMIEKGVNFVFIDLKPPRLPCNCVHSDNFGGAFRTTEHLIKNGHRRIAYLYMGTPELSFTLSERLAGYRYALLKNQIGIMPELECYIYDKSSEVINRVLNCDRPPTAIVAQNDAIAMFIYENLVAKGISVPDDISLVGFDNLSFSRPNFPGLTTVNQDFYTVGYSAAHLLWENLEHPTDITYDITVPVELIVKSSVKNLIK